MRWLGILLCFAGCGGDSTPIRAERVVAQLPEEKLEPMDAPAESAPEGCTLVLELTDASSAEPVVSDVRLYRLGVPADGEWTAGDALWKKFDYRGKPWRASGLPPGRYRVFVAGQRAGTSDPLPFDVTGPETRVSLALPMPREFEARLVVVNERGEPVWRGRPTCGISYFTRLDVEIDWLQSRRRLDGAASDDESQEYEGHGHSDGEPKFRDADSGGFRLYPRREMERGQFERSITDWSFEGGTDVRLVERFREPRDVTYLAVSVGADAVADAIRLPDGGSAKAAGAKIEIECEAVLLKPIPDPERWRSLELSVKAELRGYDRLAFKTTAEGLSKTRTLIRTVPAPTR